MAATRAFKTSDSCAAVSLVRAFDSADLALVTRTAALFAAARARFAAFLSAFFPDRLALLDAVFTARSAAASALRALVNADSVFFVAITDRFVAADCATVFL